MNYNYSMGGRRPNYPSNQQRGVFPFLVGGVLGYGLGANSRPNFYPVPVFPIYPPRPVFGPQPVFFPPFYRR